VARDRQTLDRIHRVRTIQLNLTRAEESQALQRVASEHALSARITALAEAVAPTPTPASGGFALGAAAFYRDRLQQSAHAAQSRVEVAQYRATMAGDATRSARRDQNAIEKLRERAMAEAVVKEMRALEEAPVGKAKRHDPC